MQSLYICNSILSERIPYILYHDYNKKVESDTLRKRDMAKKLNLLHENIFLIVANAYNGTHYVLLAKCVNLLFLKTLSSE